MSRNLLVLRSVRCYFLHQLSQHREITAVVLQLWVLLREKSLTKNYNKGKGILSMTYEEKAFNKKTGILKIR